MDLLPKILIHLPFQSFDYDRTGEDYSRNTSYVRTYNLRYYYYHHYVDISADELLVHAGYHLSSNQSSDIDMVLYDIFIIDR